MKPQLQLFELIARFLSYCMATRKPGTVQIYRYMLNKWAAKVGFTRQIEDLVPLDLELHAKTWHEVQSVQRLFQWAKDSARLVRENVFAKVKRPRLGQRKLILSPSELTRLLWEAKVEKPGIAKHRGLQEPPRPLAFRHVLLAMRATLARPQEIRAVRWEELQPENVCENLEEALPAGRAVFVLEDYKARDRRADPDSPRVLLVNKRLGRLLLRLRERTKTHSGPVFLNSLGEQWTANAIRCRMRRMRKRLKFEKKQAAREENYTSYTIRHSVATVASSAGVLDRRLADLLGHTDPRTTRRYQHLQLPHLREAMDQMENHARRPRHKPKSDQGGSQ